MFVLNLVRKSKFFILETDTDSDTRHHTHRKWDVQRQDNTTTSPHTLTQTRFFCSQAQKGLARRSPTHSRHE